MHNNVTDEFSDADDGLPQYWSVVRLLLLLLVLILIALVVVFVGLPLIDQWLSPPIPDLPPPVQI